MMKRHCSNSFQIWTQGEANESRYWFPCLDDPQVKFPREIHVTVPEDYIVISNGVKEIFEHLNEVVIKRNVNGYGNSLNLFLHI